eukprot:215788_1
MSQPSQRSAKWLTVLKKCHLLQSMTKLKRLGISSCEDFMEYKDDMQLIYISCQIPRHQLNKLMANCIYASNSTENVSHLLSQYSPRQSLSLTIVNEQPNEYDQF